jgi:hypothetical protein
MAAKVTMKRMLYVVILILLTGFFESVSAQDVLLLKSGKELKVNIIEETSDIIKYHEAGNTSGPLYSVPKANVVSVRYEKGSKAQTDARAIVTEKPVARAQNSLSGLLTAKKKNLYLDGVVQAPRSVRLLMEDQTEALRLYESGRKLYRLSNSCAYGVIFTSLIFTQVVNKKETSEDKIRAGIPGLVIDGGFIVAAIIMASSGKSKIRSSATLYNSAVNKPVSYKLDFGIQGNGIGLALKF